jgi:hypothetical protein
MSPDEVRRACLDARHQFYSWSSIARRLPAQRPGMWVRHAAINALHRWDVDSRDGLPLGDEADDAPLIEVC